MKNKSTSNASRMAMILTTSGATRLPLLEPAEIGSLLRGENEPAEFLQVRIA